MRHWLAKWSSGIRDGMWFVPAVIVVACIGLGYAALYFDIRYDVYLSGKHSAIFGVSDSGAYSILSAIATSLVTVAGVSFSITMVALSLAANQYSPRTLRAYLGDRGNQMVLGFFLGTFTYAIVMLRTIKPHFVPSLTVLVAIALAVTCMALFIYFLHHVSASLGAFYIISKIAAETDKSLGELFRRTARGPSGDEIPPGPWREVPALETGYLQRLDRAALQNYAARRGVVIQVVREVGAFLLKSECLLKVNGSFPLRGRDIRKLNSFVIVKNFRTIHQDPGFGVRQIVDIALKALSPGVNDTTTALTCIDHLAAILRPVAALCDPPCRHSRDGRLLLLTREITFAALLDKCFIPIIPSAAGNAETIECILHALDRVFQGVADSSRQARLRDFVSRCSSAASAIELEEDRKQVVELATATLRGWSEAGAPPGSAAHPENPAA